MTDATTPDATTVAMADYAAIQRQPIVDGVPLLQLVLDWLGDAPTIRAVGEIMAGGVTQTLPLPGIPGVPVTADMLALEDGHLVFDQAFTVPADASAVTIRTFLLVGTKRSLRYRLADPIAVGDGQVHGWPAGSLRW